jgi:hypothetical protein
MKLLIMLFLQFVTFFCFSFFFSVAQQPNLGLGRLIVEGSRSHLDTPHSIGLLWTSDQLPPF